MTPAPISTFPATPTQRIGETLGGAPGPLGGRSGLLDRDQCPDRGQGIDHLGVVEGHLDAAVTLGIAVATPEEAVQGIASVEVADPWDARIGVLGAVGVG